MSIVRRIARKLGYVPASELPPAEARAYAAASTGRLLADWVMGNRNSADQEIRQALVLVRARARDLEANDPYIAKFLRDVELNVIGPAGFTLKVNAVEYRGRQAVPDAVANTIIANAFWEWGKTRNCTPSGAQSLRQACNLLVRGLIRDGEFFVRKLRGRNILQMNGFGFAIQIIEPDHIPESYNAVLDNGNRVVMGVEIDAWERPVAYYVRKHDPLVGAFAGIGSSTDYERIPAGDMIHGFFRFRAGQTRGISPMSPSMVKTEHIGKYEEAAVVNARASACKMGFIQKAADAQGEYTGDGKDTAGNISVDMAPGTTELLPPGYSFQAYDPRYPSGDHTAFMKVTLRGIAAGLGVSYFSLAGDLEAVNFSSARAGLLADRDFWKAFQGWFAETVLDDLFADWLEVALLTDKLSGLPPAKFEKFNAPVWHGRTWSWVDPEKDVNANMAAIRSGQKTLTEVLAEQGKDLEETLQQIAEERRLMKQYGVELDFGTKEGGKPDEGTEDAPGGDATADDGVGKGGSEPGKQVDRPLAFQ